MAKETKPKKGDVPADKKQGDKKGSASDSKKGAVNFSFAVPASVEEIIGRTGTRGEIPSSSMPLANFIIIRERTLQARPARIKRISLLKE